jgi:TPR repeat protein
VEDGARLLRAAAEDDPECAMLLARFIEEGKIQPAEGENTFLLIARAAEGGVPEAMRDLGNILLVYSLAKPEDMPLPGLTPEACREEAVRWLSMAADAGDEKAGLILKGVEARQAESGSPDGEVRQ